MKLGYITYVNHVREWDILLPNVAQVILRTGWSIVCSENTCHYCMEH